MKPLARPSAYAQLAAFGLLAVVCATAFFLWCRDGWFQIELLAVPDHVLTRGWQSIFDWMVFDQEPNRNRLMSDFFEVFDAMLRPHTFWLFGLRPSLSLSSIAMAVASAACFYAALRSFGASRTEAVVLTALLISTIGFISPFVAYLRPAKRLTILAVCAALYLIGRNRQRASLSMFVTLCVTLVLGFFSDEMAYALWPISIMLLWPALPRQRAAVLLTLPITFIIIAKLALPPIYGRFGTSGPRDGVFSISLIEKLLRGLLSPDFYATALTDLARSTSISLGLLSLWVPIALLMIFGVLLFAMIKREWLIAAASVSVIGASVSFSFLDLENPPNVFSQLTYYYHSALAPLVVFWIATIYLRYRPNAAILSSIAAIICAANLLHFERVNDLVRIIHLYPIATLEPLRFDPNGVAERYEHQLSGPFGIDGIPESEADVLRTRFSYYRLHPMGTAEYAAQVRRAFVR